MDNAEEREAVLMLYLGLAQGKGRRLCGRWLPITAADLEAGHVTIDEDAVRWYAGLQKPMPGVVYEYQQQRGTTEIIKPGKYVALWPNNEDRMRWSAETRAIEARIAADRREKKETTADPMEEHAKALRAVYWKLTGGARTQFLARLVYLITARRPKGW